MIALYSIGIQVSEVPAQQSGCGTNPVQDWFYVNPNKLFVTMKGAITKTIKHNTGDWFDDGDWNIYVNPIDKTFLTNSRNRTNSTGVIELEINSGGKPNDLPTRFPVGTQIEAGGAWVEDMGHDPTGGFDTEHKGGRTEIHPVDWMRSLGTNPVWIYAAQDDTGRFANAELVNWQSFDFPLISTYIKVTPWAIPASQTKIFAEEAKVARGTTKGYLNPDNYSLWVYLDRWWFSDCESVQRVTHGDPPFYWGKITQTTAPLLKETVSYSVSSEVGTGQKIASIKVAAELATIPQALPYEGEPGVPPGGLAYSEWHYDSSAGVTGTIVETKTGPHRIEFSMPYAPAIGFNQNSWRLSVIGSSVPYQKSLPSNSNAFAQSISRIIVAEGRNYTLDRSAISLAPYQKGGCTGPVYLTVEPKLLPQIGVRAIRWMVTVERDSDGFSSSNPIATLVTKDTPLDEIGFRAQTYGSPNEGRLDVLWKPLASGEPNLSVVTVSARAVTELGEEVEDSVSVAQNCGLGEHLTYGEVLDYTSRYARAKGYKGELYKAVKNAKASDKKWLEAIWKFTDGRRLTKQQAKILLSVAKEGKKHPAPPRKKVPAPLPEREIRSRATPIIIPTK